MCRPLPLLLYTTLCLFATSCGQPPPAGTKPAASSPGAAPGAALSTADIGDFEIGTPLQHANLTVFPVMSTTPRDADRFITLEEGLAAGTVEVLEMGAPAVAANAPAEGAGPDTPAQQRAAQVEPPAQTAEAGSANGLDAFGGNEVNRLVVVNRSDKPLYLMPGEVIVGGSQDRCIGQELIVAADGKPMPIDVYCVEHGRWGLRAAEHNLVVARAFVADPEQAPELAAKANEGKFAASAGYLTKASRVATQAKEGQTAVWETVAQANLASGVQAESGAFTHNYVDADVLERLQPYIDALARPVADQARIVGVVVAINGKAESVDVFESTPLFAKLWPKLLRSYSLDALHVADAEVARQACSVADATAFLKDVLQAGVEKTDETEGGLVVTRRSSDSVMSFSAGEASPAAGGFGGGGFGGGVHTAGFSK